MHLLSRNSRSLAQIAAETGFRDATHLIPSFRDAVGLATESWRRSRKRAGAALA